MRAVPAMRMVSIVPLLLLASAFVAGCSSPVPEATVAPSGPSAQEDTSPLELAAATCEVPIVVGAGVPGTSQGSYLDCPLEKAGSGLKRYAYAVLEADFPEASPTVTAFRLALMTDGCNLDDPVNPCSHAEATSPQAPVRLETAPGFLQDHATDGPQVRAWLEGVAAQQDVRVAVTLVPPGLALPEGYTALS